MGHFVPIQHEFAMTITGDGKASPIRGDDASLSPHTPTTSSDVEKKPDRLADGQAGASTFLAIDAINTVNRGWTGGRDFSTSPRSGNLPADTKDETRAVIDVAPTVFETLFDTGQAAVPWTLSVVGPDGATLAGPDAATVKVYQIAAGGFNVARMPRTFHEQLVTRQRNEPLQNFESRTDFLARLRNFDGPLEAVLCLCKSWQRNPNTNEILMRGNGDELRALWNAIAPTDAAIAEMRHRLESSAGIAKTVSMESAQNETPRLRVQKRIHDQMDTRREAASNKLKSHSPAERAEQVQFVTHSTQTDTVAASMHGAPTGQHPSLETIEIGARDAQRGLVLQPRLTAPATAPPKAMRDCGAAPEPSTELRAAWTAIDAIRRIWSSSKCSDHLIGGFLEMSPKQVATIFGQRTLIPPPQASHLQQRADMNLDALVAAIRQGKSISNFPHYVQALAPLRTLIAMDNQQRETFRKLFRNG